ncbi:hypothetical protein EGI26_12415 [Lacihabitans sp. CCS-44]|uniref:YncE family protein n=1 Tax=Lacihabitans sp. CCS-44 TaxID=2487331 RepID=UPI0020CDBC11|nr:hypothetical protein [Lacihabitans sp. CCS-44]MCP9755958.1 hypothetical protein [Lacihabitans sp. CCS-44]
MFIKFLPIFLFSILFSSCKTQVIKSNSAIIINGADNNLDILDLKRLRIKSKIKVDENKNYFAHHVYFSKSKEFVSIALPAIDFSKGHDGMHMMNVPGRIVVLNSKKANVKVQIDVPTANHNAIVSPNEKEVWTTGMSHKGRIYVYDLGTGKLKDQIMVNADPSEIIFSKDEKYAAVACGESSFVTIIDVHSKKIIKEIKVDPNPSNVWAGFENNIFVENSLRKTLNIIDLNSLKVIDFIDFDFTPGFAVYNVLNREIWVCSKSDDNVYIYKQKNHKWIKTEKFISSGGPHMIAFFDGSTKALLINQFESTVLIIDAQTKKEIKRITTSDKPNGIAVWE